MSEIKDDLTVGELTAEAIMQMSDEQKSLMYNNWISRYSSSINNTISRINQKASSLYNPHTGNSTTAQISGGNKNQPSQKDLEDWLKNPQKNAKKLRDVSAYFEDTIMQYKRTLMHFKKILSFRYTLNMQSGYIKEREAEILNAYGRCLDFLRDFDVKYHSKKIMDRFMDVGGVFYYFENNDDFKTFIELPIDYCYITGRWDRGLTFAIDLSWFDTMKGLEETMPELYNYYKTFLDMRKAGVPKDILKKMQYYPVPIEKGFVFTFDESDTQMIPPLTGVFRDANRIFTYKNLLMQKTALDTWKIIGQKIPLDKETQLPIFSPEQAQAFVGFVQNVLPEGTAVFATPMDFDVVDLTNTTSENNIVGRGEELYWRSVGVNGTMMDAGDKSATTLEYSLVNDEGFVSHVYDQLRQFINLQLRLVSRNHRFGVNIFGNTYTDKKTAKDMKEFVVGANSPVGMMYAYLGYEPFEVLPTIELENALKLKEKSLPIISGSQMSGDAQQNGAPKKEDSELSDSGAVSRVNDTSASRSGA